MAETELQDTINKLEAILASPEDFMTKFVIPIFLSIDEDKSGKLQLSEIEKFLAAVSGDAKVDLNTPSAKAVFTELDKDKNGYIDQLELSVYVKKIMTDMLNELKSKL